MVKYPHGDKLAYIHDLCRCRPCTTAWNVYHQKLKSRHRRGEVWADPDLYRPALDMMIHGWGITPTAIERNFGIKNDAVVQLHQGGRVAPDVAARLDGAGLDDFDDATMVWSAKAHKVLAELEHAGQPRNRIAVRGMGWKSWPRVNYPDGRRVSLGIVRRLQAYLHEVTRPRCEDCGDLPLPGGFALCLPCFQARALPQTRSEIGEHARRRDAAERRRRQRAARQAVAA